MKIKHFALGPVAVFLAFGAWRAPAQVPGMFQPLLTVSSVPIGTPTSLGTNASSSANVSAITLTTTAAITAGNTACVSVQYLSNAAPLTVNSVSDGTNSYTQAVTAVRTPSYVTRIDIWCKTNASAVGSGATITATLSGTTTGSNGFGIQAWQVSGVPGPVDQTAVYQGTVTTSPTATTGALAQANEVVFGVALCNYTTCGTFGQATGFSQLIAATNTGFGQTKTAVSYAIANSTSAVTYNPTWTAASENSLLAVVTIKGN